LRIQVHVVVALQLAAGRKVVGVLGQGTGASLAVVGCSLQGIPVVAQLATFATEKEKNFEF